MNGSVYFIKPEGYGYINGTDGKEYFFHKTELTNCNIRQLDEGDFLEFDVERQPMRRCDKAIKIRKLNSVTKGVDEVTPGMHPSINLLRYNFNKDEQDITNNILKKIFYITSADEITISQSTYRYCLIKPTEYFQTMFKMRREIVAVFSDYVSFEPRSLDAAAQVASSMVSKVRIDRGCQILISNDNNIENKLSDLLKDQNLNSIVIPFSYKELLSGKSFENIVKERFKKYVFDVDLFSTTKPIENDLFFFGRRDYAQDIAIKCKNSYMCGVFGLRRSGKTSLLLAVKRILDEGQYLTVFVPCQSELRTLNWKSALFVLVSDIRKTVGYGADLLHDEKDYRGKNAASCFEEDLVKCLSGLSKPITIMFDEIENITFGTMSDDDNVWKDGASYVTFWNIIRGYCTKYPNHLSVIIAGTNPTINEAPTIGITEEANPMFGQLSASNQGPYLPAFNLDNTNTMVNTLGGYMGLEFNGDMCARLTSDCGGHPYLIRLLCSQINRYVREKNYSRPVIITKAIYEKALPGFESSTAAESFFQLILGILVNNYPKEYSVLKILAVDGDKQISQLVDNNSIVHLLGYGLIDSNQGNYAIKYDVVKRYLQGKYKFERTNLTMDEQKTEIFFRVDAIEIKLRSIVRNTLMTIMGASSAKNAVIKAMEGFIGKSLSENDVNKAKSLTYIQLFDTSVNKLFLPILSQIINNNFNHFVNIFHAIDRYSLMDILSIINGARRVAFHGFTDKSENWSIVDFYKFREKISLLENTIEDYI